MSEDLEGTPPALFLHTCRVFAKMHEEATYTPRSPGGDNRRIYEGFTTRLFQELHLPSPYYSSVLNRLKRMGCIRQLSRGGGSSPSRWELLKEPEFGDYEEAENTQIGQSRLSLVETHLGSQSDQLAKIEATLARIQETQARIEETQGLAETGS